MPNNKTEALAILDAHDAAHLSVASTGDAVQAAAARAKLELSGLLRFLVNKLPDEAAPAEPASEDKKD